MKIVVKWNFKTLLSDIPRLLLTLCTIASAFALLTGVGIAMASFVSESGSRNEGLPHYVSTIAPPLIQLSFAFTMYVLFSVSIAERRSQYRLMRSAGCTTRLFIGGILIESLALSVSGAAPGIALGILIASVQMRAVGIPLNMKVYFCSPDCISALVPLFLIVPAMMLLSTVKLRMPQIITWLSWGYSEKGSFKGSPFSRMFGAGGVLEQALTKKTRGHGRAMVISVVANLSILFLLTVGLSALKTSTTAYGPDTDVPEVVRIEYRDSEDRAFLNRIGSVISEISAKDPQVTVAYMDKYDGFYYRTNQSDLNGSVYTDDLFQSCFKVNSNEVIINIPVIIFNDDHFKLLTDILGIKNDSKGGVFISGTDIGVKTLPDREITLEKTVPALVDILSSMSDSGVFEMPKEALDILNATDNDLCIPLIGSFGTDRIYEVYQLLKETGTDDPVMTSSFICIPESLCGFINAMPIGSVAMLRRFNCEIKTKEPQKVCGEMITSLEYFGYEVDHPRFSDGEEDTSVYHWTSNKVRIEDPLSYSNSFQTYLSQAEQFFFRYVTVFVFLTIALNIVNIVHMNRLSRRREYAILTSIGLGRKQRMGMQLYESVLFTLRSILYGVVSLVLLARILLDSANDAYQSENLEMDYNVWNAEGWNNDLFSQLWVTAQNVFLSLKNYWILLLFTILFLFLGSLITEYLVNKHMDRDELIPILKDDSYE